MKLKQMMDLKTQTGIKSVARRHRKPNKSDDGVLFSFSGVFSVWTQLPSCVPSQTSLRTSAQMHFTEPAYKPQGFHSPAPLCSYRAAEDPLNTHFWCVVLKRFQTGNGSLTNPLHRQFLIRSLYCDCCCISSPKLCQVCEPGSPTVHSRHGYNRMMGFMSSTQIIEFYFCQG